MWVAALLLWPAPAHAHLVTTGLGPLYDGIVHFLRTPEDLIPVLAVSALAGLNGRPSSRQVLFALPVAWVVGASAGAFLWASMRQDIVVAASLLIIGALVATDYRTRPAAVAGLAAILGVIQGVMITSVPTDQPVEALSVVGMAAAAFVVVALSVALVVSVRQHWMRTAVRVGGSWLAAVGLLMLGWSMRGLTPPP